MILLSCVCEPVIFTCFMKLISLILLFLTLLCTLTFSQNLNNGWQFLGPENKPDSPDNNPASGVGPVEFIRVFQKNSNILLAGSLSGGLFISEDKGESWYNSGSDAWEYSGCGWADFYPENEKIIFAYSNLSDNNGKPGRMGEHGGLMRTLDNGITWQNIMNFQFFGTEQAVVYGTRFNPTNSNQLFVLTSQGLFYTNKCLDENITWTKVTAFDGMIYDMEFLEDHAYVTALFDGTWNLYQLNYQNMSATKIKSISDLSEPKNAITIEIKDSLLLVLIDFSKTNDQLWEVNPTNFESRNLLSSLNVSFGSGYTFQVNPHNTSLIFIGNSITFKAFNYYNLKETKLGSGYHVDVEFIAFDPADSNKIWMACHGGVYVSNNQGLTWENKSKGLGIAEVMGMDVAQTDANQIVIGCFHDGSSVLADFDKNGNYYWRTVNGGDALIPIIDPKNAANVFTSNQYSGGGLYNSTDTAKTIKNIHSTNGLNTSGWELAATIHPEKTNILYFNYSRNDGENKGNMDIVRTENATAKNKSTVQISDFKKTHQLASYKVYGLFNSNHYPDILYAYVLNFIQDENGKNITKHLLFRTENAIDSAENVIKSWYQLELPLSTWIGDVETHPSNKNSVYISYIGAQDIRSNPTLSKGMIYALKYNKKNKALKKAIDISRNIPTGLTGRYNLVFDNENLYFATRSGVYLGNVKTQKGKADWQKIGFGLPHCKIYGLHYHKQEKCLTVGLFGRGVWRYYLN